MYKFLTKNGQTAALGLGVLVVAVFLISAFVGLGNSGYDVGTDLNKLTAEQKSAINFFNPGLYLTVAMAVVAGLLALVVFGVVDLIKFPKSALKFGAGFVALLAIFGILYSTADAEGAGKLGQLIDKFDITPSVSKFISAGIYTTVGLAAAAAGIMVVAEIRNLFK